MTAMTRWTPARPFFHRTASSGLNRIFDEFFNQGFQAPRDEEIGWAPAADIKETEEALFVHVELPGLLKEDIQIALDSGVLTVSGERRFTKDDSKEDYHRLERFHGKFSRSFRLPRNIEPSQVKANFENGLLTLELPKTEEARPRQIEIN